MEHIRTPKRMIETMANALVGALARAATVPNTTQAPHNPTVTPPTPITTIQPIPSHSHTTHITSTPSHTPTPALATLVNQSVKRQFPGMFQPREVKRGKGRFVTPARSPAPVKNFNLTVYALGGPANVTPKGSKDLELSRAGLGKRLITVPEDNNHSEIVALMENEFNKLQPLQGRWMFYKASGGSGQRKLMVVPLDADGYSGLQLRAASNNGKNTLYLAPLQEELDTTPLPYDSVAFARMPQVACHTCNASIPLQMLTLHAEEDEDVVTVEDAEDAVGRTEDQGVCPICEHEFPISELPYHGSVCAESSFSNNVEPDLDVPGSSAQLMAQSSDWKTAKTPNEAMRKFFEGLKEGAKNLPSLQLSLDSGHNDEERDSALISFYKDKRDKRLWAAPFNCLILGDAAVGVGVVRHILSSVIAKLQHGFQKNMGNTAVLALFEGQTDHLVPSLSAALLECDLFAMAGRMVGHSAIHGGPPLSGLSPAVIEALTCGAKERATSKLCLQDCPEIDKRETISLLLKDDWSEEDLLQVTNLCLEWYLPVPTRETNRLLLFQQMLSHSVLGRTNAQTKQFRKGLKDTGIWPLITERPDVVPLLFPRQSEVELKPQMILEAIQWPLAKEDSSDDSGDEVEPAKNSAIQGFLRTFVEQASPDVLRQLLKFWTGWEVPAKSLSLQVVQSRGRHHLPTASTCYERLRIPDHHKSFESLQSDLMVCLKSVDSGFGLI